MITTEEQKINIVYITVSFKNNGSINQLLNLIENLNKDLSETYFIVCDKVKKENLHLKNRFNFCCSSFTELGMKSLFDVYGLIKAFKVFKKLKVNIIHSRLVRADFIALLLSNILRLPVLVNITTDIKNHFPQQHNRVFSFIFLKLYIYLIKYSKRKLLVFNGKNIHNNFKKTFYCLKIIE